MDIKIIGYSAAIAATTLSGSVGIFVRNISANVYIISFSRVIIGLVFLMVFLYLKKELKTIKAITLSVPILVTGILLSGAILCYTQAVIYTSLASAAFLLYLAPLLAVGIAAFVLKESITVKNGILLCLAFIGLLCLVEFTFSIQLSESLGYLWGLGSAVCYALFIVFNRKISRQIPALIRSFYQLLFATIMLLPFVDKSIFNLSLSDLYWLIALGFFQGFLAVTLLILAIQSLKTIEYGTISYIEPLVASIIGYSFYAETLSPLQLVGCSIVLLSGVALILPTKYDKT